MVMPRLLLELTFKSGLVFSTLWKKITDDEKRAAAKKPVAKKSAKKPARPAKKAVKKVAKKVAAKPAKKTTKKAAKKKK